MGINGTISFKTSGGFKIPLTNTTGDAIAVQRAWDFNEGWFANPVFINSDYPFTPEEKRMINGSGDVFAHDAYSSQFYFGENAS